MSTLIDLHSCVSIPITVKLQALALDPKNLETKIPGWVMMSSSGSSRLWLFAGEEDGVSTMAKSKQRAVVLISGWKRGSD